MTKRLRHWSGALLSIGVALAAACGPMPLGSTLAPLATAYSVTAKQTQTLLVMPDAGAQPLVDAIDNAKKTVDIEVYILAHPDVMSAMTRAVQRGVQVRCLLEPEPFNPTNPNNPIPINKVTRKKMADSGVFFRWANKETFSFTHQKSMVIDSSTAFIMTMNLSKAGTTVNREFVIVERDPQRVGLVQQLFEADWSYGPFQPTNLGPLVISPNNSRDQLTNLIASAKKSLAIEVEVFYDPAIFDQLGQKAKDGVAITVLLPSPKTVDLGNQTADELRRRGVTNVRFLQKPTLHTKLIVADNTRAYIGSINPTTNSMDKNRELGILLDDPTIVGKLISVNGGDWSHGQPFPTGSVASPHVGSKLPIDFDTGE